MFDWNKLSWPAAVKLMSLMLLHSAWEAVHI